MRTAVVVTSAVVVGTSMVVVVGTAVVVGAAAVVVGMASQAVVVFRGGQSVGVVVEFAVVELSCRSEEFRRMRSTGAKQSISMSLHHEDTGSPDAIPTRRRRREGIELKNTITKQQQQK